MNAYQINSVIDHLFYKLGQTMPEPVFMKESFEFATKATLYLAGFVIFLTSVIALSMYLKSKKNKKKQTVTVSKFDKKGTKVEETSKEKDSNGKCKKIFKDGVLNKTICLSNKKVSNAWKGLIILVVIALIALLIPTFNSIKSCQSFPAMI